MARQTQKEGKTRNRKVIVICLVISGLMAAGAAVTGISDNIAGALLCWGAVTSFMVAFVHHWRRSRSFYLLLGGSVLAFAAGAILHNLFWGLGQAFPDLPSWILFLMEAIHVGAFLVAVIVCPPGILIGLVGWFACVAAGAWQRLFAKQAAG